jgi:hypothetical protein
MTMLIECRSPDLGISLKIHLPTSVCYNVTNIFPTRVRGTWSNEPYIKIWCPSATG